MLPSLIVATVLSAAKPPHQKPLPDVRAHALKILGAEAPEWTIVSTGSAGVSFVQHDRVKRERQEAEAWILTIYLPRNKPSTGEPYGSTFNLEKYDCANNKYQTLEYVAYGGQNRDGEIVARTTDKHPEWERAIPGTVLEERLESICRDEWKSATNEEASTPLPSPSIRLPSFYHMLSADGQSTSSVSADCSFVLEDPKAADCRVTQLSVRRKVSPENLQAEQEKVRKEAAAEAFDPNSKSTKETCAALAKEPPIPVSPAMNARLELLRRACATGTKEAWVEAAANLLVFDTRVCKVNTLDNGIYRFKQSQNGMWKYSGTQGMCDFQMDITIEEKDGFPSKYTTKRARGKDDDFCSKMDKNNTQVFDHSTSEYYLGCDEIEFGF